MARKLLSVEDFRSSARDGGRPEGMVVRASADPAEAVDGSRRVKFTFSDGTVDRAGDSIDPKGWQLDNFNKNPVALFGHDSWNIDSVIGRAVNVSTAGKKLVGEIEFAEMDINPKADMAFRMVKAGLLSAVSVGFLPLEYSFSSEKDRPHGIDFTKQELLEISLVPVPCNANAVLQARSLGIDVAPLSEWAQRILDGEGKVPVARTFLEEVFRAAKTPRAVRLKYLAPDAEPDASDWRAAAARNLDLDQAENYDGAAAAARIFAAAGFDGDTPDADMARSGFLLYDAANPGRKGSYRLPFCDIVEGELKAVSAGLNAAAARLSSQDVPQEVLAEAKSVVDGYVAVQRAGRKISAETATKLNEAIGHHEAATACLRSLLGENGANVDAPEDVGDPADVHDPVMDGAKEAERQRRVRLAHALKLAAVSA